MNTFKIKSTLFLLLSALALNACSPGQLSSLEEASQTAQGDEGFTQQPEDPNPGEPQTEPDTGPVAPYVAKARWEDYRSGSRAWTEYAFDQIDELAPELPGSVPGDIKSFCPNYENLDYNSRRNFWVYLLSAMVHFESYYNPATSYQENFNDASGRPVVSRGLLQISIESGRAYGCVIPREQDLHDPKVNLDCGLKILRRWVVQDGVISGYWSSKWRGGARYWSVLRKTSTLPSIKAWSAAQPYCK